MIENPEVCTYLDINSIHLPESERAVLSSLPWPIDDFPFGWWVWVPHKQERDHEEMRRCLPKRIRKLVFWASDHGMSYVKVDRDGCVYPELETYEED